MNTSDRLGAAGELSSNHIFSRGSSVKRRKPRRYDLPNSEGTITATELRRAGRDTQLDVMRQWFDANYEDPVENTPYETAEGGYIYIWGGLSMLKKS